MGKAKGNQVEPAKPEEMLQEQGVWTSGNHDRKNRELAKLLTGKDPSLDKKIIDEMLELGIDNQLYRAIADVAHKHDALIFIRATNTGVIKGFSDDQNVTGKTLLTKGKSSEFLPIKANLAFLSVLAKSNIKKLTENNSKDKLDEIWKTIEKEQDNLLSVIKPDKKDEKFIIGGVLHPRFLYIPKFASFQSLKQALSNPSNKTFSDDEPAPDYIYIEMNAKDYKVERVENKFFPETLSLKENDTFNPNNSKEPVKFLWVKVGGFEALQKSFREEMKTKLLPIIEQLGEFSGFLVKSKSNTQTETYYRLYIHESAFNYSGNYWDADHLAKPPKPPNKDIRDCFSPAYEKDGKKTCYRALSVMAQAKVADSEIKYYEIMADYDIFAICPSIASITDKISEITRKLKSIIDGPIEEKNYLKYSEMIDENLSAYFLGYEQPKNPELIHKGGKSETIRFTRGITSNFEENIRKDINDAINSCFNSSPTSSPRGQGISGKRFVLHGCEVNNYFFTEPFNNLIMVLPISKDEPSRPRHVKSSSDNYVNLPTKGVFSPINNPAGSSADVETKVGIEYNFIYNLAWSTAISEIFAGEGPNQHLRELLSTAHRQVISFQRKVADSWKPSEQSTLRDITSSHISDSKKHNLQEVIRCHIVRLAFYGGYYYYLFKSLSDIASSDEKLNKVHTERGKVFTVCEKVATGFKEVLESTQAFRKELNSIMPDRALILTSGKKKVSASKFLETFSFSPKESKKSQKLKDEIIKFYGEEYKSSLELQPENLSQKSLVNAFLFTQLFEEEKILRARLNKTLMDLKSTTADSESEEGLTRRLEFIDFIFNSWFFAPPYDELLEHRMLLEVVYYGLIEKYKDIDKGAVKTKCSPRY